MWPLIIVLVLGLSTAQAVGPLPNCESGYLPIIPETDTNIFYWYCPAQESNASAPVVLWLNGGPGASDFIGFFYELGPYEVQPDLTLSARQHTWNQKFNMLFVDQPANVGYSYTSGKLVTSNDEQAEQLYSALSMWFKKHPSLQKNDFYITGESFGGHYVPLLAHKVFLGNKDPTVTVKINLVGLAIGNGWIEPELQIRSFVDFDYSMGLVDENTMEDVQKAADLARDTIQAGKYDEAMVLIGEAFGTVLASSGFPNVYDMRTYTGYNYSLAEDYLNKPSVKKALGVPPSVKYEISNQDIYASLFSAQPQGMMPLLPDLFNNYKVLLYAGQFDPFMGYESTRAVAMAVNWRGSATLQNAVSRPISVGTSRLMLTKADTFTLVMIAGAGHLCPMNQPESSKVMIENWVFNKVWE